MAKRVKGAMEDMKVVMYGRKRGKKGRATESKARRNPNRKDKKHKEQM
jgi:hypothetical protein